jgi:SPP1 gp7 family putative phage head morphogenesis protein
MLVSDIIAKEPPEINPDMFMMPFDEHAIEMYLLYVYTGEVTKERLSMWYHERVGGELDDAVRMGFKVAGINQVSPEYQLYQKLRHNIYVFSAAKQYQQVRTMSQFITIDGVKSTYSQFKALAEKVFVEYNDTYLRAEYVTAIGQSQMAREWVEAEQKKDIIPYLQYRTQRDSRVRDEHAALDGITLPVDHPFWKTWMPKNGWRCRCFTVSKQRAAVTDLSQRDLSDLADEKKFPKTFQMNPGIDGLVFNPKHHPYFFVERGDAGLKKNNFNLPIP